MSYDVIILVAGAIMLGCVFFLSIISFRMGKTLLSFFLVRYLCFMFSVHYIC